MIYINYQCLSLDLGKGLKKDDSCNTEKLTFELLDFYWMNKHRKMKVFGIENLKLQCLVVDPVHGNVQDQLGCYTTQENG